MNKKNSRVKDFGDYIAIERHVSIDEYEVEGDIYENPSSSWIELKMYNFMD